MSARWAHCGFCGGPMLVGIDGRCVACERNRCGVAYDLAEPDPGDIVLADDDERHDMWGSRGIGTRAEMEDDGLW
jgi:hypothetical protein